MIPALNILVLNHLAERHVKTITGVMPGITVHTSELAQAASFIADTDILVSWGWMDIRELFLAAPKLKWVHALSAGVENLVFPEIQASSVILTNSRGIHGIPVSEHVLALMLAFTRGLNRLIRQQTEKRWKRVPTDELHEKTIGIVGLGSIGREIAKKAKGLGMNVLATKREMTTEIFVDKLYTPDRLVDMLAQSDFVVVALPQTEETREYFRLEHFEAMKRTAYFINIARGTVVREADLVTALEQGLIQGAGLDVFEHEPLPENSPLWDMPNVIITPHLAALSPYYLDRAVKLFADNLARFCQGGEMFNVVDKQKGY
ncbi:D-2-hydroxyacid dehydrogenase [Sporolituus thermophilus]|uniref:Phosphoglycerate dehydrogenase n=1 Tax=Sporolituus thermophilus DSM 23256 TaxID=1123285 RepID=A0A1G7KE76_9FIRM|nr:D-2-hydroxyacid dehydrogenase [Sporolituus thermophilus]SDF35472.1 Phosphoglycerate dehydrogenase [Sporolituus thermophilus DSM 23256]